MTTDPAENGPDTDPGRLQVTIEKVTPDLAAEWLELNVTNRNLREQLVAAYARDMTSGNWHMAGEPIKFSKAGKLLDGQHRLWAVVTSGVTVELLVVRGLEEKTQQVMDSGAARTASDALKLRNESNWSMLAGAAKLAINLSAGRPRATTKVTHAEIMTFIDDNPDFRIAVDCAARWRHPDMPPSPCAVAVWRTYRLDQYDCEQFFTQLSSMAGLYEGDPVLALAKALGRIRREREKCSHGDYLSLVFRAWNASRSNKSLRRLAITTWSGNIDIPEPL